MLHCTRPQRTLTLFQLLAPRRNLASKTKTLPPLDQRNRTLNKAENDLKALSQEREAEISDPPKKKVALYAGSITTLAGLGLATYSHSAALFTIHNLTLSLISLGSGMLLFSMKDHEGISKFFSKDTEENSDEHTIFSFKLLNEKNMFSKEFCNLESICHSANSNWPVEVQARLNSLLAQDVTKLENEIATKR